MRTHTPVRSEAAQRHAEGAACRDCHETWEGDASLTKAKAHVKTTGHTIHAAVTRIERWQPKDTGVTR